MATKAKARKNLDELKGVKYLGASDRSLSVEDLAGAGVDSANSLLWDDSNDHFVDVSQLNAATADFLFAQDEFELV